jgi:uncharacterized protein (DUF169 family)
MSLAVLQELLGEGNEPVAVFLLQPERDTTAFVGFEPVRHHRYCQAVMRARHGESVMLDARGLSCPAAAAAFGFRPLPANLTNGRGLVGFGIVADPQVGSRIFERMPRLAPGSLAAIAVCPLRLAPRQPDVVVVEGSAEVLMWLVLADLNVHGGERRSGDTAVLQAACADSTIVPHLEGRLNYSLGCYGCREATDLGLGETVIGFPGGELEPLLAALAVLRAKAVSRSRSKSAYASLRQRIPGAPAARPPTTRVGSGEATAPAGGRR